MYKKEETLLEKVHLVRGMFFPVVMYGCEIWTIKKAEHQRIGAFELWCWRVLLRVPWTARISNQSIPKKINPEYSLQGLMLNWSSNTLTTLHKELTHWKRPWCWERLRAGEKRVTEDEIVAWHHRLNGHEFEQTPGESEGQGSLVCCSPWDAKSQKLLNNWITVYARHLSVNRCCSTVWSMINWIRKCSTVDAMKIWL